MGFLGVVSANDCEYITGKNEKMFIQEFFGSSYPSTSQSFLSSKNIAVAIDHLKDSCGFNQTPKKQKFPRSSYIVDHLLDVMMRSLDGDPKLIYGTMQLDDKGQKYREDIREISYATNSITPLQVQLTYEKYRLPFWNPSVKTDSGSPSSTADQNFITSLSDVDDWSLTTRYYAICNIVYHIMQKINQTKLFEFFSKPLNSEEIFNTCIEKIKKRLDGETAYVNMQMIEKGNKFLQDNFNAYTYKYFANTRLQELLEGFLYMQTTFGSVNSKVVEGTNQCKK